MTYTITGTGEHPPISFSNAPPACVACPFYEDYGCAEGSIDLSALEEVEWIDGVGLVRKKDSRE
jgi:hypothetical protein